MAGRNSGYRCNPCAERMAARQQAEVQVVKKEEEIIVKLPVKKVEQSEKTTVDVKMNAKTGRIEYADEDLVFADQIEQFIRAVMREQQRVIAETQQTTKQAKQVKLN